MDVSIIIVNYNTFKLTMNSIKSVLEKTKGINYEIILVDNSSSDCSLEKLKQQYSNVLRVKIIVSNRNLGFGKGNNLGLQVAKGKYVFLLNSDTILLNNSVKKLFDFMEMNIGVGICGGNLYYEDMSQAHSFGRKVPSLKTDLKEVFFIPAIKKLIFKKREDFNYTGKPLKVGYITGADMMIKKEILDKVGIFDEDFFMYYEEVELTNRIKKEGYSVMSVPSAKIIHLESKSFQYKEQRAQMMYESRYKYFNKVYGKKSLGKSRLINNLLLISRFLIKRDLNYYKMLKINNLEYKKYLKSF